MSHYVTLKKISSLSYLTLYNQWEREFFSLATEKVKWLRNAGKVYPTKHVWQNFLKSWKFRSIAALYKQCLILFSFSWFFMRGHFLIVILFTNKSLTYFQKRKTIAVIYSSFVMIISDLINLRIVLWLLFIICIF